MGCEGSNPSSSAYLNFINMFIGKNQDGTFSVSESSIINEDNKWILEDNESNAKIYSLFKGNLKDAENFENALNLNEELSSDDYESTELVSKSEILEKVFDRLSDSLVHFIDESEDPFEAKNRILQDLEEFMDN
ncbi:MAG TPA: hypothetical protein DCR94_01885 [Firmicutes bacterium]|nr:hypothetical protein [Bacillota bacterium]